MTNAHTNWPWSIPVLLFLGVMACTDEPKFAPEVDDDVVEDVAQALGMVWTNLWSGPAGAVPIYVDPERTVFTQTTAGCDQVTVRITPTGASLSVPVLPGCARVTAASSVAGAIYVADSASAKIYSFLAPGGIAGSGTPNWSVAASGTSGELTKIIATLDALYWQGGPSIYRKVGTGSPTMIVASRDLLAVGVNYLLVQKVEANGTYSMGWTALSGGNTNPLTPTSSVSFLPSFSMDSVNVYWADGNPAGGTQTLKRMKLSNTAVATLATSSTVKYQSPSGNGSTLCWREQPFASGPATIQCRVLSTWAASSASFPMLSLTKMVTAGNAVFAAGTTQASPLVNSLQSIPL